MSRWHTSGSVVTHELAGRDIPRGRNAGAARPLLGPGRSEGNGQADFSRGARAGLRGTIVGLTCSSTTSFEVTPVGTFSPLGAAYHTRQRDLLGDHHVGDVVPAGDVVHHRLEHLLHDRAEAAGAGAAEDGLVGDRLE